MEKFRLILAIYIGIMTVVCVIGGSWFFIALSIWTVLSAEVITFGTILGACLMFAVRGIVAVIAAAIGFALVYIVMPR